MPLRDDGVFFGGNGAPLGGSGIPPGSHGTTPRSDGMIFQRRAKLQQALYPF